MNKLILTTEDGRNITVSVTLSNKITQRVYDLQYMGGFKRFDIEYYSDKEPKQKSQLAVLMAFLGHVFDSPEVIISVGRFLQDK